MTVFNQRETSQQIILDEDQEELHCHNDEECSIKDTIENNTDLIEEVQLDLATEDK